MKTSIKTIGLLAALAVGLTSPLFAQVPDLTAAGANAALKTDPASSPVYGETYNLGATGMRGWICNKMDSNHERAQGRTTLDSRQILVTHVGAASPADGVVKVDDVILGVDGKPFSDDARKSIARAIQEAETKARDGVLKLTVWRAGQTQDLSLKLAVMGTYSDTAPWNCEKSKRILKSAIKVLEKEKMEPNWAGSIQGLALLATGKPEYLPKLRDFAHGLVKENPDPNKKPAGSTWGDTWNMGYRLVFLCEYYMITRDKETLPAIERRALQLARGQSMYGTFGHGFAALTKDGKFNGSVPPYGPVNMGESAKPAIEDILKALVATAEPSWPIRWEDPVQVAHGQLAAAVLSGPLREELNKVDPKLRNQAIRAVSTNPDGMARAQLEHCFQNQLSEDDVIALAPVILAAVESPSPADTMFNNSIRMAGLTALTKYHFEEGIAAAVGLAKTQGGHGSESRTGEIMKMITGYGSAAKPQIPALRKLITSLNAEVEHGEFPGDLNKLRVGAVEEAIKAIEAAKDHPQLRSITSASRKTGPNK